MRERGINSSEEISFTQFFTDFLKNLRPGLDITRISLPSFLLRPYSYLESAAENSTPDMQLLLRYLGSSQAAPAAVTTANSVVSPLDSTTGAVLNNKKKKESAIFGTVIDRLAYVPSTPELAITRWMLVMLANTPQKGFRGVKPNNPILGEQFMCDWHHEDGSKTHFISEQVSHHPPISAIYFENSEHGIVMEGAMKVKATFGIKTADTRLLGYRTLHLLKYDEMYDFILPNIQGRISYFFGSNCVEYSNTFVVSCAKTGYKTTIDCRRENEIKGKIVDGKGNTVYKIRGNIIGEVVFEADSKHGTVKQDVSIPNAKSTFEEVTSRMKRHATSVHLQHEKESRRVWHDLSFALKVNNMDMATKHKLRIEEEQRRIRKTRTETLSSELFEEDATSSDDWPVWVYKKRFTREQFLEEQQQRQQQQQHTIASSATHLADQVAVSQDEVQELLKVK